MNEIQKTLSTLKDVLSSLEVQMKSQTPADSRTVWNDEDLFIKFSNIDAALRQLSDRLLDLESRVDDIEDNSDDSVKNRIDNLEHKVDKLEDAVNDLGDIEDTVKSVVRDLHFSVSVS